MARCLPYHAGTFTGACAVARLIAFSVSDRFAGLAAMVLCLMATQAIVASCTPEPAPYGARVAGANR